MPKAISATELRKDVYNILDAVLATGEPQEILRGSARLLIVPASGPRRRLGSLPRREGLACTPDELVATSWEDQWSPGL